MKSKIAVVSVILLMLFFAVGCETIQKETIPEEEASEETEEEMQAEQPVEETEPETAPEGTPEETEETVPEETEEIIPQASETTTLIVTPETVKPAELVTVKVTPNKEYGYKTTIKIYDVNNEVEERVKQIYIKGCGSICKKEKSTTFKAEYDWKGDYCARVIDVETNKEVGACFKVE